MPDPYYDLQQSYGRCLRDRNFIEHFYQVLMASHPDIGDMFVDTDFARQRLALRRGISVAIFHAAGSAVVKRTTEQMADIHSRGGRCPVPPELYPYWVESLIKVITDTDPQAAPHLLERWREAMCVVTDTFTCRFDLPIG